MYLTKNLQRWEEIRTMTQNPIEETTDHLTQKETCDSKYELRFEVLKSYHPGLKNLQQEWKSFINYHFLIHLINKKRIQSDKTWEGKPLYIREWRENNEEHITILGSKETRPTWLIIPNFAVHLPTGALLDKNFILMQKFICLTRLSQLGVERVNGFLTPEYRGSFVLRKL